MKIFEKKQFIELSGKSGFPFISIYLPTSRQSNNAYKEDKILFKNQLQEIDAKLKEEKGISYRNTENLLAPAYGLLDNDEFWKYNSDMLAVFIYEGGLSYFQMPLEIKSPRHFIGSKPMLLPMIPELSDDGHFYLLLLNLENILLYEVTRNAIQEIHLELLSPSFTAEEEDVSGDKAFQERTGSSGGSVFHGQSENSSEKRKRRMLHYFHKLDNELVPFLNKNPLPLYLAGVEYLIPIYRQANSYGYLMDDFVSGAYDHNDMMILHAKSWEIAAPYFEKERLSRKESLAFNLSKGLAVDNDPLKLIKAAMTGGVDTLIVNGNHEHLWGTYDENTHVIHVANEQEPGMNCLIDEAASKVIAFNGKVFVDDTGETVSSGPMVGILRYPI